MLFAALAASLAVAAPPRGLEIWSPDAVAWTEARPGGAQRAILEGDLQTPGQVVTYAFHLPAGAWFPAHTHQTAARVFVLKGVLLLGEGPVSDRAKARRILAGEAVLVPGGLVHFEGAEEDTVIVGVATGPWTTRFETPPPSAP